MLPINFYAADLRVVGLSCLSNAAGKLEAHATVNKEICVLNLVSKAGPAEHGLACAKDFHSRTHATVKNSESTCFVVQCLDLRNELVDEENTRIEVIWKKLLNVFI